MGYKEGPDWWNIIPIILLSLDFMCFPLKTYFFKVEAEYFEIKILAFRKPKNPVFAHIFSFDDDNSVMHSVKAFLLGYFSFKL